MATQIGVIDGGRIVQVGAPREIYEAPTQRLCRPAPRPAANQPAAARGGCPISPAPAGAETIGARTEHLQDRQIGAIVGAWQGRHGSSIWATRTICMSVSRGTTSSRSPIPTPAFAVGDDIGVSFVNPLFFDVNGDRIGAAP